MNPFAHQEFEDGTEWNPKTDLAKAYALAAVGTGVLVGAKMAWNRRHRLLIKVIDRKPKTDD